MLRARRQNCRERLRLVRLNRNVKVLEVATCAADVAGAGAGGEEVGREPP